MVKLTGISNRISLTHGSVVLKYSKSESCRKHLRLHWRAQGTHITGRDGNNWLRVDLLHRNHFELRFFKVISKLTNRSLYFLEYVISDHFPRFGTSSRLSAAYRASHWWPSGLPCLFEGFFSSSSFIVVPSVFIWKKRSLRPRRGCSLKPAVPFCEACVSPWPWAFSEGLLPGETASGSLLPR